MRHDRGQVYEKPVSSDPDGSELGHTTGLGPSFAASVNGMVSESRGSMGWRVVEVPLSLFLWKPLKKNVLNNPGAYSTAPEVMLGPSRGSVWCGGRADRDIRPTPTERPWKVLGVLNPRLCA